jgi:hypothetical protein
MKRFNLYLPEEQIDALESIETFSVSEHIRIALGAYIKTLPKIKFSESPSRKEDHGRSK